MRIFLSLLKFVLFFFLIQFQVYSPSLARREIPLLICMQVGDISYVIPSFSLLFYFIHLILFSYYPFIGTLNLSYLMEL